MFAVKVTYKTDELADENYYVTTNHLRIHRDSKKTIIGYFNFICVLFKNNLTFMLILDSGPNSTLDGSMLNSLGHCGNSSLEFWATAKSSRVILLISGPSEDIFRLAFTSTIDSFMISTSNVLGKPINLY